MTGTQQIPSRAKAALARLQELLPLAARLRAQSPAAQALHRAILQGFVQRRRALGRGELARMLAGQELDASLAALGQADLIVLGSDGALRGAYPFTLEPTPHRLEFDGEVVHAMCAVDALAVAPLIEREVTIVSRCAGTNAMVRVHQRGRFLLSVRPSDALAVGIGWQDPHCCAAHSLCRDMVFLRDPDVAERWRAQRPGGGAVLTLDEAIEVGARFFAPLLAGTF